MKSKRKNPAAVALGRAGGKAGKGVPRGTKEQKQAAAKARWDAWRAAKAAK